jgi:hypothetical protein
VALTPTRIVLAAVAAAGCAAAGLYFTRRSAAPPAPSPAAVADRAAPALPGPGASAPTAPALSDAGAEPVPLRRLDAAARASLLARIAAARAARTGVDAAVAAAPDDDPRRITREPPREPHLPISGQLSRAGIQQAVRAVIPLLAECYSEALPRLGHQGGTIELALTIAGEPEVGTLIEQAELSEASPALLTDPELATCLRETIYSVEFAPMTEGESLLVRYPMAFSDDGEP